MTREIKFRGRRLDNGKWAYGSLLLLNDQAEIVNHDEAPLVDPSTVGQYTGLKDRNGKEIYEGDILRSDTYPFSCLEDGEKDNYYAVVQWCEEDSSFAAFKEVAAHAKVRGISAGINIMDFSDVREMELVSNIHDNPELLRGSSKIEKGGDNA